jgi:hypothetical protein
MPTFAEAAARARRCEKTVRAWVASGRLPATKVAGRVFVAGADLDALLTGAPVAARAGTN